MATQYFIGVDVGTASVRAALVDITGKVLTTATKEIKIWNPQPNFYQQSSTNIWEAVVYTVKMVCGTQKVDAGSVKGIGFDATCSLVVADQDGRPLSVCPKGEQECDIIMWMDHRAGEEADFINATKHDILKYYGGGISLEMEPPKLLWLKKHLRSQCWEKLGHAFDLCDFVTWRATGSLTRSVCSTVAKWTYTKDTGFDTDFFKMIGLGELSENKFCKIGENVKPQGRPCLDGLCGQAARELGLKPGTVVSVGILDAHSATIGCLGCKPKGKDVPQLTHRLAMISGTSTCHMLLSEEAIFVPGVWGPNWSTIIPGMWSAEGGQSAAGKLIDYVIETHAAYQEALAEAEKKNMHISDYLYEVLKAEAGRLSQSKVSTLTEHLHVWPDFHGNRSPLADHTLTVVWANPAVRCGQSGPTVPSHSPVTGWLPVVVPDEKESVLLGSAILAASAAGLHSSIQECMEHMSGPAEITQPDLTVKEFYDRKFTVFLQMYQDQRKYKSIMAGGKVQ
ncbi:FGGY carbohydrate kinase domain-containing protein-like isoform X2 [Mya arenaria]|uniref:FGGY carbohydrate kinase domain-containing protein-like isoform X2 n=1 Tax=Mya arenaria TaxID=6604 RepID=UPI0022E8320C|nr:FGGY carbohydrate kinase domain-containing protein-like isoform X2 [Mya arenaria]